MAGICYNFIAFYEKNPQELYFWDIGSIEGLVYKNLFQFPIPFEYIREIKILGSDCDVPSSVSSLFPRITLGSFSLLDQIFMLCNALLLIGIIILLSALLGEALAYISKLSRSLWKR